MFFAMQLEWTCTHGSREVAVTGMLQLACSRHLVSCEVRYVVQVTEVQGVRKESLSLVARTTRLCDNLINTTSV
jgi:hypothetical protein